MTQYERAFITISGQYLCEYLPNDYMDWDNDDLEQFISDYVWEGVENLPLKDLLQQMDQAASTLITFGSSSFYADYFSQRGDST